MLDAEFGENLIKKAVARGDRAVDAELSTQLVGLGDQRLLVGFPLADHLLGKAQELFSLVGQHHRAVVAHKQLHAEIILQLLDIAAECGWADVAAAGGPTKMQAAGKGAEKAESGDIHNFV